MLSLRRPPGTPHGPLPCFAPPCLPPYRARLPIAMQNPLRTTIVNSGAASAPLTPGNANLNASGSSAQKGSSSNSSSSSDPLAWWKLDSPKEAETNAFSAASGSSTDFRLLLVKLSSLCAPDMVLVSFAVFHMLVAAAAELSIPHFVTTCIFASGADGATMVTITPHLQLLTGLVLIYGTFAALRGFCFSVLNNRMTLRMRMSLFENLVQRETAFFDGVSVGALTSRLQSDCQAIAKCISGNFNIALRNLLQLIGGFVYLWVLSKEMCLVTLGISFILWAVTLTYGHFARKMQKISQDVLACSNQVADEVLSLSRLVRAFGTERKEQKRYSGWLGRLYNVGLRQAGGYATFVLLGHIACYTAKVVALLLGCTMVVQGNMSAEDLTNYIFYTEFVIYSSLNVCDEFTEVMEALGASERVLKLMDGQPAPQIRSIKNAVIDWSGNVAMKDISFRYPSRPGQQALDHLNLDLKPGRLTALVGLSGSGKSSVVVLLKRLYDPTEGAILLDGVDLRELNPDWYRSNIGIVMQEPKLFSATVASNIAYGCSKRSYSCSEADVLADLAPPGPAPPVFQPEASSQGEHSSKPYTSVMWPNFENIVSPPSFPADALSLGDPPTQAEIEAAARQANAHDFIMALPQGYQTLVTDKLLSGGQKQRIALARALIRNPKLLVLDEATSALDAESEAQVQEALERAMHERGRAVLVIAHRLSTVRKADSIVVLEKGKVSEEGSHMELLKKKGLYWQLVMRQAYGLNPDDLVRTPLSPPGTDDPEFVWAATTVEEELSSVPTGAHALGPNSKLGKGLDEVDDLSDLDRDVR